MALLHCTLHDFEQQRLPGPQHSKPVRRSCFPMPVENFLHLIPVLQCLQSPLALVRFLRSSSSVFLEHHLECGTRCVKLHLTQLKNWCVLLAQSKFHAVYRSCGVHARKHEICFQILTLFGQRHGVTVFVGWELRPVPSEVQPFQLFISAS